MVKNQKGCWYKITVYLCPLCLRETIYRERQDPPRPETVDERVSVLEYCCCDY